MRIERHQEPSPAMGLTIEALEHYQMLKRWAARWHRAAASPESIRRHYVGLTLSPGTVRRLVTSFEEKAARAENDALLIRHNNSKVRVIARDGVIAA